MSVIASNAIWINAENHTAIEEGFDGILTTTRKVVVVGNNHWNIGFRVKFTPNRDNIYRLFVDESIVTRNCFAYRDINLSHNIWYRIGLSFCKVIRVFTHTTYIK